MSQIKTNTTALQDILNAASNLPKPIDTSDATATSSKILSGYTAYVDNKMIAGNIPNKTSNDVSVNGNTVNIPAGNYENDVSKSVGVVTQATPSISIDSAGKITTSATQTAGYVSAGTKTATKQLTTQAAQTITPGTSDKTAVSSGVYTTGATIVKGDANLKAENILGGKSIFGVSGGIPNNGSVSQTIDGINTKSVSVPAGYTSGGTVGLDNTIDNAVSAAIAALIEKEVEIPDGTNVTGLAALIAGIEAGGGWLVTELTPAETINSNTIYYNQPLFEHNLGYVPRFVIIAKNDVSDFAKGEVYIQGSFVFDSPEQSGKYNRIAFTAMANSQYTNNSSVGYRSSETILFGRVRNASSIADAHWTGGTRALVADVTKESFRICVCQGYAGVILEAGKTYIMIVGGE